LFRIPRNNFFVGKWQPYVRHFRHKYDERHFKTQLWANS
jgi:hypothetical protein